MDDTASLQRRLPLDMQGMIGMMQVLAGRAHTIHEVYRGQRQLAVAAARRTSDGTIQCRSAVLANLPCRDLG